jgi:hypothetical protein
MSLPRAQDPNDRKWAAKARELEFDALTRVKSAAEKWATTIASLTGVFGIITLIKGPEDITELTMGARVVVGVLLFIAVLCAAGSIYLAALAAQGVPNKIWLDASSVRKAFQDAADKAADRLSCSRKLVVPAVILLAIAIGLTWFGPRPAAPIPAVNVLVVQRSGAVSCGELKSDEQGHLALKAKGELLGLNEIVSLSTIAKCP